MDSRYGEEVVVGVGGASGLVRIDPGRPCGAGRRSAEEGDGGGSRRFSGKMERREWDGCAARKEEERSSLCAWCSVERLNAEWAGEAVRRGAGGTPASNGCVVQ